MKVSFAHPGGWTMASYRYRAQIPSQSLGASLGNEQADVYIITKPIIGDVHRLRRRKEEGKVTIVDFCDDHFDQVYYKMLAREADVLVCGTSVLQTIIRQLFNREATVIEDPYEYEEKPPHGHGDRLFWFGHKVNWNSCQRILPLLQGYPIRVVTNIPGFIPWSYDAMRQSFAFSDIVLMPRSYDYKGANRTVESIRQGCFVVAEPHPVLMDIPGIWKGDIVEGVQWATKNWDKANSLTEEAQAYVRERFSPKRQADAWKKILAMVKLPSMSGAETSTGKGGSALTTPPLQTASVT